jgi:hypothetical protein
MKKILLSLTGLLFIACSAGSERSMGNDNVSPLAEGGQVASPQFSNSAGSGTATITGATISLSSSTTGATIMYTLDNSIPSASNGVLYTQPIVINVASTTIKAIAIEDGMTDSLVVSNTYTVESVQTPFFTPASGTISAGTPITLKLAGTGHPGSIYYTIDGSTPSNQSTLYSAPFYLPAGTITVNAIGAYASGIFLSSPVVTATYTVNPNIVGIPQITCSCVPAGSSIHPSNCYGAYAIITEGTSGATIHYTQSCVSGSNLAITPSAPNTSSTNYSTTNSGKGIPIPGGDNCQVQAIASAPLMTTSAPSAVVDCYNGPAIISE